VTDPACRPFSLPVGAVEFVREELTLGVDGFDGALAQRLLELPLDRPFAFLGRDAREDAIGNLHSGGVDDGRSDAWTATVLAGWLNAPGGGGARVLALEEPLARWNDEAGQAVEDAFAFGNRVFHLAAPPTTADRVRHTMRRLSGYPGMGVLSCPDRGIVAGAEASAQDLDALARAGVAVLVRAWDDEAFMIAPVSSRITLETLWECREHAISDPG
jgi:hypothetical protein